MQNEIENIKDAVDGLTDKIDERRVPTYNPPEDVKEEKTAPVFIKVEKYQELLQEVQDIKAFVRGAQNLFHFINEVDDVRNDALSVLRSTVQRIDKDINMMDSKLLRPQNFDSKSTHNIEEAMQIENSLENLRSQLKSLSNALESY